jgi:hypothetical protein
LQGLGLLNGPRGVNPPEDQGNRLGLELGQVHQLSKNDDDGGSIAPMAAAGNILLG